MTNPDRAALPVGLVEGGVVAIARHLRADGVGAVADGLLAGGVRVFELTLNDPEAEALAAIEAARRHVEGTDMVVGAGTILSVAAAERAVDAGATFLVLPHGDLEIVGWAAARGIPVFPGAFTPTEVLAAWRAGATAVKLFPASVAGPGFIRELRGPFPDIPIIPTGGVTAENAAAFVRAGAIAVGLASWLIGDGEAAGISERAAQVVRVVAEARAAGR